MASENYIKAIPQSLPKKPKVASPGAVMSRSRGLKPGVVRAPRIEPINTRIYAKAAVPEDPSKFYHSAGFNQT